MNTGFVKTFDRKEPVNTLVADIGRKICENFYTNFLHNAAVNEMKLVCQEMTKHNDYDINHYRISCKDVSDLPANTFAIDIVVEYIGA